MEDALAVHELYGPEYLEHIELYFLESQGIFLVLEAFVQIHVHEFEDKC